MGLPSILSPMKAAADKLFTKTETTEVSAARAQGTVGNPKLWCEAQNFALLVCTFGGGPHVARSLAASCKAFHQSVNEAWGDLTIRFPTRLYVVGGLNNSFREVDTAWRLDPAHGVWEALPNLAQAAAGSGAAVACGRLYIFGGELSGNALRDVQCFDPVVGSWETLPPMIHGRIRPAAVFCGGYIYVLGGLDGARALCAAERYNPATNTWEELPPMHRPRYAGAATALPRGSVIAFAGELTEAGLAASIEVFDPEANAWELLPAVRTPSCGAAVALVGGGRTAFQLGGLGLSGQALPAAEQLNLGPALACASVGGSAEMGHRFQPPNWGPVPPMLTPRHLASAAGFGSGAAVVGGKGPTFEAVNNVEIYDPEARTWQALAPLPSPRLRAAVVSGRF
mmetsp:Transcript_35344/g.101636  ORF Transcript_35344/g.101636 Transcript_35344/m.101636 type:complete len:397 (-) Transcript_35344:185-1375(-)